MLAGANSPNSRTLVASLLPGLTTGRPLETVHVDSGIENEERMVGNENKVFARAGGGDEQGRVGGNTFARRRQGPQRPRNGPEQPRHAQHDAIHHALARVRRRIRRRRAASLVPGARLVSAFQHQRSLEIRIQKTTYVLLLLGRGISAFQQVQFEMIACCCCFGPRDR